MYPYYYPSSESAHGTMRGQLSAGSVNASAHMGQSVQLGNGIALGTQSPAVGVSVNISPGSTDTVSI